VSGTSGHLAKFTDTVSLGNSIATDNGTAVTLNGNFYVSGNAGFGTENPAARLAVNGGVHVGGDSDPGANNLLVDGGSELHGSFYWHDDAAHGIVINGFYGSVNQITAGNDGAGTGDVLKLISGTASSTISVGGTVNDVSAPSVIIDTLDTVVTGSLSLSGAGPGDNGLYINGTGPYAISCDGYSQLRGAVDVRKLRCHPSGISLTSPYSVLDLSDTNASNNTFQILSPDADGRGIYTSGAATGDILILCNPTAHYINFFNQGHSGPFLVLAANITSMYITRNGDVGWMKMS
jgi:hypothetical protein